MVVQWLENRQPPACDAMTYVPLVRYCPRHNARLRIVRVNGRDKAFFECLHCEYREDVYPEAKRRGWPHALDRIRAQVG